MTDTASGEGPAAWTVDRHLADLPASTLALYRAFMDRAEGIGPFTLAVSKSAITLKGSRRGFAGVVPRAGVLRGYLDLQRVVTGPRITSSAPYTRRLFVHYFRITEPGQLDDEFVGWLREAYAVGAGAHVGKVGG
ncbi:DUF5655 domain-containing protein [Isoptericola sp. NPDC057191]|uniref:DUF5655 domain-containing protein n=1 Tax=Isoptericola sp. NPDC057191 TaxID=3346041 RepID=UPI00363E4ECE